MLLVLVLVPLPLAWCWWCHCCCRRKSHICTLSFQHQIMWSDVVISNSSCHLCIPTLPRPGLVWVTATPLLPLTIVGNNLANYLCNIWLSPNYQNRDELRRLQPQKGLLYVILHRWTLVYVELQRPAALLWLLWPSMASTIQNPVFLM